MNEMSNTNTQEYIFHSNAFVQKHIEKVVKPKKDLQVNNFQKVSFVYYFIKEFEQKINMTVLLRAIARSKNPGGASSTGWG